MKKSYILVIDSGLGGVSVLKILKDKFPQESFIYVADNSLSPYGNKTKKVLKTHILKVLNSYISKFNIKLIIFACNTLTASTIKFVRKNIKINIIGTEPPIKQVKNNKKTLVLATNGTIKYSKLLKKYKNKNHFTFVPLKDIATLLDKNFFYREEILKSLKKQIPKQKFKNVVLGCTHYYFLKHEIAKILYGKVKFYDALSGIVKRVKIYIKKSLVFNKQTIKIFVTKKDDNLKKTIKNILNFA